MVWAKPAGEPGRSIVAGAARICHLPQRRSEIVDKFDELRLPRGSRLGEDVLQMGLDRIFRDGQRLTSIGNRAPLHKMMQGSRFGGRQSEALGNGSQCAIAAAFDAGYENRDGRRLEPRVEERLHRGNRYALGRGSVCKTNVQANIIRGGAFGRLRDLSQTLQKESRRFLAAGLQGTVVRLDRPALGHHFMRHPIGVQDLAVGKNRNKSGVEVIKRGTQGFEENIRHGRSFVAYRHNDTKPDKIMVKKGNSVGKTHAPLKILFTLLLA